MSFVPLEAVVPRNSIRFLGHGMHAHDCPHLVHQVRGRGELVVDGQRYSLAAGESLWMAAHVPHSLRLIDGGIALGPMLDQDDLPPQRVLRIGVVEELRELMVTVLSAAPQGREIAPFRRALGDMLRAMHRRQFELPWPSHPTAHAIAPRLEDGDPVALRATLAELAMQHFTSVRQIQRLFLDETGISFTRWRTRARLNHASNALERGLPLAEAACNGGYVTRDGFLKALARERRDEEVGKSATSET